MSKIKLFKSWDRLMNAFECPFSLYARKFPHSIALMSDEKSWSYKECHEQIEGITKAFKNNQIKPGDRVALFPTKTFPTPLLFFALFRLGAICCPLNPALPKEITAQSLDLLGATFFLVPDKQTFPKLKQTTIPFSKLLKARGKPSQIFLHKETLATHLMTSGTTAQPKVACHSLGNHYYSALGSNARLLIEPGDNYLLSLPLYHIAGIALLFRSFLAGATVLLSEDLQHRKATHLSLVPTQLYRLLKNPTPGKTKRILLGGDRISHPLYQEALQKGWTVYPTYGMTEMSSQIATHFEPRGFSLGHPLPFRDLKIEKDGEIYVRGKTLFQGYFSPGKELDLPLNAEGWFCTRDLGTYSPKTGLQVIGRKDRLFISGGENIHPEEIEKILENIEGIQRAKVVPTPDHEFGFRPVAYIESQKECKIEELKSFLTSLLPKFKIPIAFYPWKNSTHSQKTFR